MTDKELMLAGKLYNPAGDPQLKEDFMRARRLTRLFNSLSEEEMDRRMAVIKELFGSTGEWVHVEQTFHCDYGCHIHVGEDFYANYDCTIIDVCEVRIGDNVFLAPKVGIYTAAILSTPACAIPAWSLARLSPSGTMCGSAGTR